MKKKIIALLTCVLLFLSVSAPAFAMDYTLLFTQPFSDSFRSSTGVRADGELTPWIQPSHTTTPTTYFLVVDPREDDDYSKITGELVPVTNIISGVCDTVRRSLTYAPNYGGRGQKYCVGAYPSYTDFLAYTAIGNWEP